MHSELAGGLDAFHAAYSVVYALFHFGCSHCKSFVVIAAVKCVSHLFLMCESPMRVFDYNVQVTNC